MVMDNGGAAQRMVLGCRLRKLREAAAITRTAAGDLIRGSESKISRMELGRVSFKRRDVEDLLSMYGIDDPDERASFLQQVEQSNQLGCWQGYGDRMSTWLDSYWGLEETASLIRTYQVQVVPELLQTEAYARAVISQGMPGAASEDIERRVAFRMRRQEVLARAAAPNLWAVIDESVLIRRTIGGRDILLAQIDKLLELTSLPHITLQIVRLDLTGFAAECPCTLFRFPEPELPDLAHIEYLTGALYLDKPDEIEAYNRILDRLAVSAETPEQTRRLLKRRRGEI